MFKELKDYIASHTKEEIQEDWKETPEKSLNAFNRILDSICEEEKNDSKDESR